MAQSATLRQFGKPRTLQRTVERLAEESGIRTPSRAELIAFDRRRQGRKTSNKNWQSATDEEARIARLKDGRTHMAYKPEHVVDLESGAVVSAVIHPADRGDTRTIATTLGDAQAKLCSPLTSPLLWWRTRAITVGKC